MTDLPAATAKALQLTDPADLAREICDLLDKGFGKGQLMIVPCDKCRLLHCYVIPGQEVRH